MSGIKPALMNAGAAAAREHLGDALVHILQLEKDVVESDQYTERERALFMRIDLNNALERIETAKRALNSMLNDVVDYLGKDGKK